jgi:type I restriction enzyme, S subunit
MSNGFPKVALSEVLQHNQDYIEAPEPRLYPKLSVRLYGKGVVLDTPADGSSLKMKRHQLAKSGQVILSEIWGKKGAIGFVPPEGEGALCTSHFFLFDVRRDLLEPKYLQAIFTANYLEDQLGSEAKGTTGYAAVRPKNLLAAKIPLPLLEEQQRIVERIDELAAKVEEARRLRQQTINDVSALVSSLHLELAQGRYVSLADILSLKEDREEIKPGRYYPQVGVKGFGAGLFAKEGIDGAETTYKTFNRLFQGAIVLSQVKGWEGAVGVCDAKLAGRFVSPEYRTFRCTPGVASPVYLAVLFSTPWFWNQLKTLSRGVGGRRERTRPEHFLGLQLHMPTIEQQERAVPILRRLDELKRLQLETLPELDALLPSILDKAFSGEL